MTFKAKLFLILTLLALTLGVYAHSNKRADEQDLPNFGRINKMVFRGAQPSDVGIRKLSKEFGIKTIIYLRQPGRLADRERETAENAGLKFINIPLHNWFKPTDEQISRVLAEINKKENQPVFVHCNRGADRTGTVMAAYRLTHDGFTTEQALIEAKRFGIGWWQVWMKDYIKEYSRKIATQKKLSVEPVPQNQ